MYLSCLICGHSLNLSLIKLCMYSYVHSIEPLIYFGGSLCFFPLSSSPYEALFSKSRICSLMYKNLEKARKAIHKHRSNIIIEAWCHMPKLANNVWMNCGNLDIMLASLTVLVPTRRESSPRYIVTLHIRLGVAVSWASKRPRAFWPNCLTSCKLTVN